MARAKNKELTAAIRAPFLSGQSVADQVKAGNDLSRTNGWQDRYSSADGTFEIPAYGVDTDNAIRIGNAAISPMRQSLSFSIGANGSIATAAFFIADRDYFITGVSYVHKTAAAGTATTVTVTHESSTQAAGAGTSITTSAFDPKATASVVQNGTLNGEVNYPGDPVLFLAANDRLSFKLGAGTITSYADPVVTVYLAPASKSEVAVYSVVANGDIGNQTFFTANRSMVITGVKMFVGTAFAAAVTATVTKDASGTAAAGGTSILAALQAMDGTANTVLSPALTATASVLSMVAGDALSTKFSATTTGTNVVICVYFAPLYNRKEIVWQLGPTTNQQVDQSFWIADADYLVVDASEKHGTVASGAASLALEILKGTTAPGSGNKVATASFDLTSTVNVPVFMTAAAPRLRQISAGDRVGLDATGAAQSVANVCVTVSLQRQS